ncbi:MAG TPA: class II aldolase/adducin family protein [Deltaproteobacteria bacterium]|nr:class II aldolase/adducin family protein [Deltaproteobacteria bacterium]HQI82132.1 class II aldolase/adducin family protein [Deltaproteobacteria bacterium]
MHDQVRKYLRKLMAHGLIAHEADAQIYGLDDEIATNRDRVPAEVAALFRGLNINSLILARPEPRFWTVISSLAQEHADLIRPTDTESLTFIHDIPVVASFSRGEIIRALSRRKACIVRDVGLVTTGSVSLEQAFVAFSSVCFACFVKFFTDMLLGLSGIGGVPRPTTARMEQCADLLSQLEPTALRNTLSGRTPVGEAEILSAMDAAGKALLQASLVDSFFGNISFRDANLLYISQTGSSLDELPGHIDRATMDGSSCCEITSSSELSAHVKIYERTGHRAILHGHPRFSVIMSMAPGPLQFGQTRSMGDIPVVAGEVGAGSRGLVHTLPGAMQTHHAALVYGHGTFVSSETSFRDALDRLALIERTCFDECRDALRPPW